MPKKIIMLIGSDHSSYAYYNELKKEFDITKVILDSPKTAGNRYNFLKRRVKRLGFFTVLGQVIFQLTIPKILNRSAKKRIAEIVEDSKLDFTSVDKDKLITVSSVNSDNSLKLLKEIAPDIIVVNGTRIIAKKILNGLGDHVIFLNTHAGITPKYRGIHGGYWSIANDDLENCGVTVHLVDPGIDTGDIVFQKRIKPTKKDNYLTYTYLQMAEGVKLMREAVKLACNGKPQTTKVDLESKLWSHPTIWLYLWKLIYKGVK